MSKADVICDLLIRRDAAQYIWDREVKSEHPNVKIKESAWGKVVAYNKALELINKMQ